MQPHEKVSRPVTKKQMIFNNFLGGVFWGVGTAFGAILFIAVLGFIVSKSDFIPFIGNFIADIAQSTKQGESEAPLPFVSATPTLTPVPTSTPIPTSTPTPKSD